jgi:hypothetical protein
MIVDISFSALSPSADFITVQFRPGKAAYFIAACAVLHSKRKKHASCFSES